MSSRQRNQTGLSDEAIDRLLRKLSEDNFEAFSAEWEKLLPNSPEEEDKKLNMRELKRVLDCATGLQLISSTGDKQNGLQNFLIADLYYRFDPQDAIDLVLTQTIIAVHHITMDCTRRASVSELPARALELNCVTKCALILPKLTMAFDSHREGKQKKNRGPHGR
jgi:hypothetical protein